MALLVRLNIIDPEERDTSYDFDQSRGIVTIGQDPGDDVRLECPDSPPFRLEIDYRQEPYCLTIPVQAGAVTINREFVPPGGSYDLHDRDVIRVAGHTITFRVYDDAQAAPVVTPPSPPEESEPGFPPPLDDQPTVTPPEEEDYADDDEAGPSILSSLPEQELAWTIDVEHTVTLHLSVVNAGPLVADFRVAPEGLPPEWIDIDPTEFHLNERASRIVTITVTPPRLPTSRAATYHLKLVVTSPDNYPGQRSESPADITIRPYYELALGNLSPRHQSISWSQPSGQVEVPLTNKGNSDLAVGLTGEDDTHAGHFEFQVSGEVDEPLHLSRQVNLSLPFGETLRVPAQIIPNSRPLIGSGGRLFDLRPRLHPYTITVTMPQAQQGPWALPGEWETVPRFSRRVLSLSILAIVLLLLAGVYWIYRPRLDPLAFVQPASIRAGQVVEWDWKDDPSFRIGYKLDGRSVTPPFVDRPQQTTTYELRADTWLSRLFPALSETRLDTVAVRPVDPDILLFEARPQRTTPGGRVVLSWVVDDARELVLVDHGAGVEETLVTPCGSREIEVGQQSAHYTLRATAADGDVVERVVAVRVGSPLIDVFSAEPAAVPAGASVRLTWGVLGTAGGDVITLSHKPLDASAPESVSALHGTRGTETRTVNSTTLFSLSVTSGAATVVETVRVNVLKPTPAPPGALAMSSVPRPASLPAPASGAIVVYTALSEAELESLSFDATPARSLNAVPDSLREAGWTLKELQEFDYVVTSANTPSANLLIVRRSTEELIRKLLAEKDDPRADVVWMVAATGMIRLRTEGLLEPLAGLYEPEGLAKIEPGWRDPTLPPEWLGLSGWAPVLCVNRNLVPEQERALLESGSWDALTDRRFRGQIVMPSPYTSGTGYMVVSGLIQMQAYGEPDAWAYMDRLHENVAWYTSSGSEPCRLVAAGQAGIGIGANICSSDSRFQDVSLVYPAPGAGWEMDAVALVRKDRIDQGALDFLAWAIGEQAMGEYATFRPMLAYDGFQPAQPCIAGLQGGEMIPDRFFWASANLERVIEKWQSRYDSLPR